MTLKQKTIFSTDLGQLDTKCNEFGEKNDVKFTQSYCNEYEGALFHFRVLFYDLVNKSIDPEVSVERVIESESEYGVSWDKEPSKFNTYSIKKKSDKQFFNIKLEMLSDEGKNKVTDWDFPKEGHRLVLKENKGATPENKRPFWRVYLEKK